MKLGVFDPVFGAMALEPMLDRILGFGLEAVELGAGNYRATLTAGHRSCWRTEGRAIASARRSRSAGSRSAR